MRIWVSAAKKGEGEDFSDCGCQLAKVPKVTGPLPIRNRECSMGQMPTL